MVVCAERRPAGDTERQAYPESGGDTVTDGLTFPDLPRLELDQLLDQLVQRAQEVKGTQGRLRGLLRAGQLVTSDLALPTLLRRTVEAARELIGARYAALGVIGPDGRLAEFVHVGMDDNTVRRVGRLPEGKGLLGAVIEDPRPIRLVNLAEDARSSGFPAGHPPMESFLGAPIRVRGKVFGNLYLTDSLNGRFTAEDEELACALAATAGGAVENSRLYEVARVQQQWLRASAEITRTLLSPKVSDRPLALIARHMRRLADADLVTVLRPTDDPGELRVEAAFGDYAGDLVGTTMPIEKTLSGQVYRSGDSVTGSWSDWLGANSATPPFGDLGVDAILAVPLIGTGQVNGVLTAARKTGRARFTAEDLEMAATFANQASVSIELADARAEQQRNQLLDERDRIAVDLHNLVTQRLYRVGLSLQATAGMARTPVVAQRVRTAVRELDTVINHIQDTVFHLDNTLSEQPALRDRVLQVLNDAGTLLGFAASTRLTGKLDAVEAGALADDLVAALRGTLQVVARHTGAGSVDVDLRAQPDELTITVTHDGRATPDDAARPELDALADRARKHGGTWELSCPDPGHPRLSWSVPLGS